MLPPDTVVALARRLYEARKTRTQIRHFSSSYPQMTVEDGYAIQREWVGLELADGRTIKGRKIGLTSRAMQQASQITEPDYAPLMDDMFFETGCDIAIERFIAPRVEVELAFVLKRALKGPGINLFHCLAGHLPGPRAPPGAMSCMPTMAGSETSHFAWCDVRSAQVSRCSYR
jgi:2-oxo-hept-3-ene-1,7-dioate hydratase